MSFSAQGPRSRFPISAAPAQPPTLAGPNSPAAALAGDLPAADRLSGQTESGQAVGIPSEADRWLDQALEATFPASDPRATHDFS